MYMHMFMDTINWDSLSDGFTKTNVNQTGFSCVNYDICDRAREKVPLGAKYN